MPTRSLLDLPPEIHNRIYRFALVQPSRLKPNVHELLEIAEKHENSQDPYGSETTLSLARTCNQIHGEAIAVYYGENRFDFKDTYTLYVFLYMIGSDRRRCIRDVAFFFRGVRRNEAFQLLSECERLLQLSITVGRETTRSTQRNLWAAHGMNALKEIRGVVNLNVHEANESILTGVPRSHINQRRYSKRFTEQQLENFTRILKSMLSRQR